MSISIRRTGIAFAIAVAALVLWLAPQAAVAKDSDEAAIRELYKGWTEKFDAKDAAGIMKFYSPSNDLVVFDVVPPLQYVGAEAYTKDFEDFFKGFRTVKVDVQQLAIVDDGHLAFTHSIQRVSGTDTTGKAVNLTLRVTDCLRTENGKWLIVHEHVSAPVDLATRKAELNLSQGK